MCGINGAFAYNPAAPPLEMTELLTVRDAMSHRGPDGCGLWRSEDGRTGLAHRRLSILDLSDGGRQPMASVDGRLFVTFNGEIYNHPELRAELEAQGYRYRSTCDTETLLHLYVRDGAAMVARLRGMFAFAIWDVARQGLLLARDAYGIKPLYYANDGWTFRFASQVTALLAGGGVSKAPEPAGAVGFLLFGSVPEPFTLYRDVRALPAGHSQWVDALGPREPQPHADLSAVLRDGMRTRRDIDVEEAVAAAALDSVSAHLMADVDVGVFLSAGVDSGAILGLTRDAGRSRTKAITLGFEEYQGLAEDEVPLAAEVARLYQAEHIVRRVGRAEFQGDLPRIMAAMDQPSIDGVNTWFVAKAAQEAGLKVVLSGVGGDEVLGGYARLASLPKWARGLRGPSIVPGLGYALRRGLLASGLTRVSPKMAGLLEFGGTLPGAYLLGRGLFLPFEIGDLLDPDFTREGLRRLDVLRPFRAALSPDPGSDVGRMCVLDSRHYLKTQLLRDADWAGMAHGLEIRTPFADLEVLRRIAPVQAHLTLGRGKRSLAAAPSTPLPEAVTRRVKTGFTVPTAAWMGAVSGAPGQPVASQGRISRDWARFVLAHAMERPASPSAPIPAPDVASPVGAGA